VVGETVGALAIEQIGRFHASHAVLTIGAVEPGGIMDYDLGEAEVARATLAQARSVTVLADSSKFSKLGLFQVSPLMTVDRLVSNRAPDRPVSAALSATGVDVIISTDDSSSRTDVHEKVPCPGEATPATDAKSGFGAFWDERLRSAFTSAVLRRRDYDRLAVGGGAASRWRQSPRS